MGKVQYALAFFRKNKIVTNVTGALRDIQKTTARETSVFPACSSWLNFRVRGQFEIKILIVRHINTTYFI